MLAAGGAPYASAASVSDVQVASAPLSTRASAMNGMVRVYLSSLGNPSRLDLTVVGNYSISTTGEFIASGSSLTVGFSSSTGAITLTHNGVKTNMGTSFSLRRHSASGTNGIKISQARESNNPYPGDLTFKAVSSGSGYTLYTIANIYIENYLYGVLPYEMGNSTNIEALKAQAVAARTYTVRMMQNRASGLYDVKDTTSDQVYRGHAVGNANCVAAVDATKGIVLMYGSSYITTYYSASNGGQTEIDRSGRRLRLHEGQGRSLRPSQPQLHREEENRIRRSDQLDELIGPHQPAQNQGREQACAAWAIRPRRATPPCKPSKT